RRGEGHTAEGESSHQASSQSSPGQGRWRWERIGARGSKGTGSEGAGGRGQALGRRAEDRGTGGESPGAQGAAPPEPDDGQVPPRAAPTAARRARHARTPGGVAEGGGRRAGRGDGARRERVR